MYKLTRLQPPWGEEDQRLLGTPRAGWQHHPALSSWDQPSRSPGQVWPIPQPRGDELHPLLISNQGKQSATSHVSASSAHSPSPASSPIPPAHWHTGFATNKHKMFLILHQEQRHWMCFSLLIEAFLVSPATLLQDSHMNSPEGMNC